MEQLVVTALQAGRSWVRFHLNFSSTSFRPLYGPGFDSASDGNECSGYFLWGKGGQCLGLTTLLLSYDECLEIWEPHPPVNL